MNNFKLEQDGYRKDDVNQFVDYVIKKTEENIITIRKQQEEIDSLRQENARLKKHDGLYGYLNNQIEKNVEEIKNSAREQADLIIAQAKNNASTLINDALLETKRIEEERKYLIKIVNDYKRRATRVIEEQLELLDDIEIL